MITTHVLDTARGRPASHVPILLEQRAEDGAWTPLARAATDGDGRVRALLPPDVPLRRGRYRLRFDTATYFHSIGVEGFYPEVTVEFDVRDGAHHHVPLLLSPFGYSTYRGS